MLSNKWFIATVAVLLTAAVAYDVWYFFLREEEEPAGQVVGSASGAAPAGAAAGTGAAPGADAGARDGNGADSADRAGASPLVAAAAEGRPRLREPILLDRVRASPDAAGWGREPLARSGALAARPEPEPEPTPPQVQPPGWELSAVMVGQTRRAAVVDGRVVRVGDTVRGGGEVVEIRRGEVVIRWRSRRITVQLPTPN